jgi:hypothetical protein
MRTKKRSALLPLAAAILLLFANGCKKDAALPEASSSAKNPLKSNAIGASGPKGVCYVEVNYNDLRNVAYYKLSSGQQLLTSITTHQLKQLSYTLTRR